MCFEQDGEMLAVVSREAACSDMLTWTGSGHSSIFWHFIGVHEAHAGRQRRIRDRPDNLHHASACLGQDRSLFFAGSAPSACSVVLGSRS